MEASAIGVVCLLLAVWGGKVVHEIPALATMFGLPGMTLAWAIIVYGLAASVLPVWLLLAPRDYLSTFMKLGTIFALALGIFLVLPMLKMPALSRFIDGSGPVVAGKVFPFCFITIACGAISGFHTLIASGTTPKILTRESYARPVGYGAMCLESLVAIMALIAACTLEPGVYLSMNMSAKGDPSAIVAKVTELGFPVSVEQMNQLAGQIGEKTLFNRTGGAATLAVGMAHIFSNAFTGRWLDLWYHFAIMFEALFILTTIDAGTRVGRYLLQDLLGHIWKPLGRTGSMKANVTASLLMVGAWGYFLIQGVRDPLGGINSLWPLFGIANQMLAAIALCLATTILLKTALRRATIPLKGEIPFRAAAWTLITLIPLMWLLSATMTAGLQKIGHKDPRIGFLSQAKLLAQQRPALEKALAEAQKSSSALSVEKAEKALRDNRALRFNNLLDAAVAAIFLLLVSVIVVLSVREWCLLMTRRKPALLHETEPVWLPAYAVAEAKPVRVLGILGLGLALAKQLSGEAELERQKNAIVEVTGHLPGTRANTDTAPDQYLAMTERRFKGVNRCC
jgi:carbon starvation protein